ncbi:MAG: hypothetical protein QOE06_529 [Thermoleophilaceae bacterium]|nr:hypothetical protein [Thermoleophilaceae bacterium]
MLSHASRLVPLVLAGILAAALVASGCGGSSDKDKAKAYRTGLAAATKKFDTQLTQAGATMSAAGQAKSRAQYGQGAQQLQRAAVVFKKEIGALDTPSDAQNEEKAALGAVDRFTAAVRRINSAVQADDKAQTTANVAAVQTTGAAVDQAIQTLKDAVK